MSTPQTPAELAQTERGSFARDDLHVMRWGLILAEGATQAFSGTGNSSPGRTCTFAPHGRNIEAWPRFKTNIGRVTFATSPIVRPPFPLALGLISPNTLLDSPSSPPSPPSIARRRTMSAQPQSPLLSLPAELRRDILTRALTPAPGLHLFLHDGRPRVSPCLGARLVGEDSCERRVPFKLGVTTQERQDEWVRRLESKWANHYMCEEVRDGRVFSDHPAKRGYMYALLVCKQM